MDIQVIKIFNHLAGTLHFGKTSRFFNMTPSTLSRTIQRLELEVGRPLFLRDSRSVQLTPAGEMFREYAAEVEQKWYVFQRQLAADQVLKGSISLYCSVTAANALLPDILEVFRKKYEGIQLHLQTGDAAAALAKLQNGEVDITIAALPEKLPPEIHSIAVATTPLVFIAPLRAPEIITYYNDDIDWEKTPIIIAEHGLSRVRIERWFANQNIIPNIYAQVAGNEALLTMVGLGFGIGVIPQLVLEKSLMHNDVVVMKNVPQLDPFIIGVCMMKKKNVNPLIQAFWDTVQTAHGV